MLCSITAVINLCEEKARPVPSRDDLSEMELEVLCNLKIDWRRLAAMLHIPQETVKKIERGNDRERDRCRRVLKEVPITRTRLVEVLRNMKWYSAAESLLCGCIHR